MRLLRHLFALLFLAVLGSSTVQVLLHECEQNPKRISGLVKYALQHGRPRGQLRQADLLFGELLRKHMTDVRVVLVRGLLRHTIIYEYPRTRATVLDIVKSRAADPASFIYRVIRGTELEHVPALQEMLGLHSYPISIENMLARVPELHLRMCIRAKRPQKRKLKLFLNFKEAAPVRRLSYAAFLGLVSVAEAAAAIRALPTDKIVALVPALVMGLMGDELMGLARLHRHKCSLEWTQVFDALLREHPVGAAGMKGQDFRDVVLHVATVAAADEDVLFGLMSLCVSGVLRGKTFFRNAPLGRPALFYLTSPGHAFLLGVQRKGTDSFHLTVINSGSGLRHHPCEHPQECKGQPVLPTTKRYLAAWPLQPMGMATIAKRFRFFPPRLDMDKFYALVKEHSTPAPHAIMLSAQTAGTCYGLSILYWLRTHFPRAAEIEDRLVLTILKEFFMPGMELVPDQFMRKGLIRLATDGVAARLHTRHQQLLLEAHAVLSAFPDAAIALASLMHDNRSPSRPPSPGSVLELPSQSETPRGPPSPKEASVQSTPHASMTQDPSSRPQASADHSASLPVLSMIGKFSATKNIGHILLAIQSCRGNSHLTRRIIEALGSWRVGKDGAFLLVLNAAREDNLRLLHWLVKERKFPLGVNRRPRCIKHCKYVSYSDLIEDASLVSSLAAYEDCFGYASMHTHFPQMFFNDHVFAISNTILVESMRDELRERLACEFHKERPRWIDVTASEALAAAKTVADVDAITAVHFGPRIPHAQCIQYVKHLLEHGKREMLQTLSANGYFAALPKHELRKLFPQEKQQQHGEATAE